MTDIEWLTLFDRSQVMLEAEWPHAHRAYVDIHTLDLSLWSSRDEYSHHRLYLDKLVTSEEAAMLFFRQAIHELTSRIQFVKMVTNEYFGSDDYMEQVEAIMDALGILFSLVKDGPELYIDRFGSKPGSEPLKGYWLSRYVELIYNPKYVSAIAKAEYYPRHLMFWV